METIQTFVLGAASALALTGLGYIFISVLGMRKTVNKLKENSKDVEYKFDETRRIIDENLLDLEKQLHRRMDDMCRDMERINSELRRSIDELNSYTDSRFDKTIDKLTKEVDIRCDEIIKAVEEHQERLADIEADKNVKVEQINS
jgi:hypothetical protein